MPVGPNRGGDANVPRPIASSDASPALVDLFLHLLEREGYRVWSQTALANLMY